jgi:hypothetical protein
VTTAAESIHKFEAAGLGKAPFRFVGVEKKVFVACPGAPAKPGGTCDYCGQGITYAFHVASADGKQFAVGCDCIRKTGDAGLIRAVKEDEAKQRRAKSEARRQAGNERAARLLAAFRAGECVSLHSQPHPKGREGTAHDYVAWCLDNKCWGAGVLKIIEKTIGGAA